MPAPHIQRVIKVGDSLAAVLPRYLTDALGIQRGQAFSIGCTENNVLTIRLLTSEEVRNLRPHAIE